MRMQGNEQVVCQLLIATYCQKSGVERQGIAGNNKKAANIFRKIGHPPKIS